MENIFKLEFVEHNGEMLISVHDLFLNWGGNDFMMGYLNPNKQKGRVFEGLHERVQKIGGKACITKDEYIHFLQNYSPARLDRRQTYEKFKRYSERRIKEVYGEPEEHDYYKTDIDNFLTLTECAKMLNIGVKKDLVPFLIENKAIYRTSGNKLLAYDKELNAKRFETKQAHTKTKGVIVPHTVLTQAGFKYWSKKYEDSLKVEESDELKFLREKGIIADNYSDFIIKGIIADNYSDFIIKGMFGKISLIELLKEYGAKFETAIESETEDNPFACPNCGVGINDATFLERGEVELVGDADDYEVHYSWEEKHECLNCKHIFVIENGT